MFRGSLRTYTLLSRLSLPKSYAGKILLAAFLGVHVPLLGLVFYLLFSSPLDSGTTLRILTIVLVATLAGSVATLFVLYALLAPVSLASRALRNYLEHSKMPDLPIGFVDRAGKLMADVQYAVDQIERLDRATHALEELSMKDHLTGVYNRRACEERLAEDVARAARGGGALTLVVLDVDEFKLINDRHGHPAGDTCLKHVVAVMGRNIRKGDWLARWGGDEFVVVLWGAEEVPSARATLERIGRDLRENAARLSRGDEVRVTLSAGVCRYTGEESAQELFAGADKALYQAKREGRGGKIAYNK